MDRRQAGEKLYRQKFIDFGLAEKFEFLNRDWTSYHGRRVFVKCKTCGETFSTWNVAEIFKGAVKRLLCPECGSSHNGDDVWERSPLCDKAMAYYVEGHTVKQTAKKFGVKTSQINASVKFRGLTNGRNGGGMSSHRKEQIRTDAEKRLKQTIVSKGFEYLGGYTRLQDPVKIRCPKCKGEFVRTADFLRKGNITCHFCEHEKALEKQRKKRELARQQAEVRRVEREWHRLTHPKKDDRREKLLDKTGICEVCGKEYTVREYVESCGLKYARDSGVCSAECRSKKTKQAIKISHKGRHDSHRHRARKYGCDYDPSITLKKLVKRDGLQCSICGGLCDWNDHSWSKYSGPTYPSIDHIIPMSKGGGHTWNNVQVAHILCNSYKCDNKVVKE